MKEFIKNEKKLLYICAVVTVCIALLIILLRVSSGFGNVCKAVYTFFNELTSLIKPLLFGYVIAYLLHRPCLFLQKKLTEKKYWTKRQKAARIIALACIYLTAAVFVVVLCVLVIPNAIESIAEAVKQFEGYNEIITESLREMSALPFIRDILSSFGVDIANFDMTQFFIEAIKKWHDTLSSFGGYLLSFLVGTSTFFYNFIIGFIIAVYIQLDWDALGRQMKKLAYALFPRRYEKIQHILRLTDGVFSKYITARLLSSCVLGIMCYALCLLFKIRYAPLIGLVTAFSNLIPIFGVWIGSALCVLFALSSGVEQAIKVAVIIFTVQQIENCIIEPKFIGKSIYLNGFWVFVAVILSARLSGVFGMLIAVPVFSVFKTLLGEWIGKRRAKYRSINNAEG